MYHHFLAITPLSSDFCLGRARDPFRKRGKATEAVFAPCPLTLSLTMPRRVFAPLPFPGCAVPFPHQRPSE